MPPTSNPSILSRIGLALEPSGASGKQLLLAQTAIAATLSLTTQPSGGQGQHIQVLIIGNTATGTVTITGKDINGNNINETSYTFPTAPSTNLGYQSWTSKQAFGSVNASGVTSTGLTNAAIIIFGCYAGKYLVPVDMSAEDKLPLYSPADKRGIGVKNIRLVQLDKTVTIDKFDSTLYPFADLWFGYAFVDASPTIATVPSTPTVLMTATAFSSAPFSLSTQPKFPAQRLLLTVAGNSVAGTITITGQDQNGNNATETITVPAGSGGNKIYYSSNRYSAVNNNGITVTGLTSAATLTVGGAFAFNYTFTCDGINLGLASLALEWYTGADGIVIPYAIMEDGSIDWQKDKEMKLTAKGEAQDFLPVGNILANSINANGNPFAALTQPVDLPVVSWPGLFWIDTLDSGTPGTTVYNDMLSLKFNLKTGQKPYHTGDGSQIWSRITHDPIEADFDMTIDFQNELEYNAFLTATKRAIVAQFLGDWIGQTGTSTPIYEFWQLTLPAKYETYKRDNSKDKVEAAIKGLVEYDFSLGYYYQLVIQTTQPPNYTL